jgi:hypothetical protein
MATPNPWGAAVGHAATHGQWGGCAAPVAATPNPLLFFFSFFFLKK